MTWFEELTGFRETSPAEVRRNISLEGETLTSRANGRVLVCGRLETPSLGELRQRVRSVETREGRLTLREVIGDVQRLHSDQSNAGSVFQVASQFNLLEMVGPDVTPEQGIGIYEQDHTQGPSCAIAAGAGTIYRNYFVPVNGQVGQSTIDQIDCLADLGSALGNTGEQLWRMQNGYALPSTNGLGQISERLRNADEQALDELRELLRTGVQWNTQVTIDNATHTVTQVYCSALPISYSNHSDELWEPFARLVLEATYEATICIAILNSQSTGSNRVFLTQVGGGAFGNKREWILSSMRRAFDLYRQWNLDVAINSYSRSSEDVRQLIAASN